MWHDNDQTVILTSVVISFFCLLNKKTTIVCKIKQKNIIYIRTSPSPFLWILVYFFKKNIFPIYTQRLSRVCITHLIFVYRQWTKNSETPRALLTVTAAILVGWWDHLIHILMMTQAQIFKSYFVQISLISIFGKKNHQNCRVNFHS